MKIYYVDGKFLPSDKAVIPVDDLAVLRGYGVCDIMRTYKGRPYFINEHIERILHSAKQIGLSLPWSNSDLKKIIVETLNKNKNIDEANIRIVVTGGSSPDFLKPLGKPRLIVLVTPIKKLPEHWYTKGVKVITHLDERAVPGAKVTSYIPAAMALEKAEKNNAIEALYINQNQEVIEGTTSNLFAFFGNTLVTPDTGMLKGITRKLILELAIPMFKVEKKKVFLEELLKADEVFITGTNKGVVPVVQIDETSIGKTENFGKPGKNTKKIIQALDQHTIDFVHNRCD